MISQVTKEVLREGKKKCINRGRCELNKKKFNTIPREKKHECKGKK